MPLYCLKCPKCGNRFEQVARMHEREHVMCPGCGADHCESDVERQGIPATPKDWDGPGSTMLSQRFDTSPEGLAALKADMPSAEVDRNGSLKFRNSRHQRQVFKEASAAMSHHKAEHAREKATAQSKEPRK